MKKDMRELGTFGVTRWLIGAGIACWLGGSCGWAARADRARTAAVSGDEGGRITVEVEGVEPDVPVFFSARAEQVVILETDAVTGSITIWLRVIQGNPEVLTLGLSGDGEVTDVSGSGLRGWSIRHGSALKHGFRFLDLHVDKDTGDDPITEFEVVVQTRIEEPEVPGSLVVLTLAPGDAVGFSSSVELEPGAGLDLRVDAAPGMISVGDGEEKGRQLRFQTTGTGRLEVTLVHRGGMPAEVEMVDSRLLGVVSEDGKSVAFNLGGRAVVSKAGSRLRILSGPAGLSGLGARADWSVELVATDIGYAYEIVFDRAGSFEIDLAFAAKVWEAGDWRKIGFSMPAGAVVPIELKGLGDEVEFDGSASVVPVAGAGGWGGYVPGNGDVSLAWKQVRESGQGALFFTSSEQTELRVGGGLVRQDSRIEIRVLQGELGSLKMRLEGSGEILGVKGENILAWTVVPGDTDRVLKIQFARPVEEAGVIEIRSQMALGTMPATCESLRLVPIDSVRHSGMLRLANRGAVRLEVTETEGLLQMEPDLFTGRPLREDTRQVFVYRFPSAGFRFGLTASQIQPEVGVSQIITYELEESDRVIQADIELDIREAPLREWPVLIPEDYAVLSVMGNGVVDYVLESAVKDGRRVLRVLYGQAVQGRQLLHLRLEENRVAGAGTWNLPPLAFPDAVSVRGHIGIVSLPGYRMVTSEAADLVEVPLSYFPRQVAGLQQAWRIKERTWSVVTTIEALGQSIQADVFHLYSLKEGIVQASVLINYFVVGAPASEWTIRVPESAGNVDVVGQNVRRDWRRIDDEITISLHRPVLGAATLLITFEQPMSARGGTIQPGVIQPIGVQGERGYVQIVSPLQVKYEVRESEATLLRLDPLELPTEYRLLATAPTLAVYQYTARPFTLEMDIQWYERTELVDQVVDFAQLNSVVSGDGQVVTTARFFVKTRGRKALRMVLPERMDLWETRVDGVLVNARRDGEQTLIPLSARMNPNEAVEVTLRLGQASEGNPASVVLNAPRLLVPTVISVWNLRCDPDRVLIPDGGNADLTTPYFSNSGFEWMERRGLGRLGMVFGLILAGGLLLRAGSGWRLFTGVVVSGVAVLAALFMMGESTLGGRSVQGELSYAASVVPAGVPITIRVTHLEVGEVLISWPGVLIGLVGVCLVIASRMPFVWQRVSSRMLMIAGMVFFASGILAQGGGATGFFAAIALMVAIMVMIALTRWWRNRDGTGRVAPAGKLAALGMALGLLGVFGVAPADLLARERIGPSQQDRSMNLSAESMHQSWEIRDDRLFAELDLVVRGVEGNSYFLLDSPAVLTGFDGEGLRVGKSDRDGRPAYYVALERDGVARARVRFELALEEGARRVPVLTGPAAIQQIRINLDQGGWAFASDAAVRILPGQDEDSSHSRATLILAPGRNQEVLLVARSRDTSTEETVFFAEASNLFLPGPGVVNGVTLVTIRPVQGRVSSLAIQIPAGFTVGDVRRGPVGDWRFDPEKRVLRVEIEPQQARVFRFLVETQMATRALPVAVGLEPLRILDAAGEVGMVGLAFGDDAQAESLVAEGLSTVSVDDFEQVLVLPLHGSAKEVVMQSAWRYGRDGGRLELTVAPVAPEVRVKGRQIFSIDDDRLVVAAELTASIMRVGLFSLSFALPDGLEVEALSGSSLSHWVEGEEDGERIITLHLVGQTMGDQGISMTLVGAAPEASDSWSVPRITLREATRQTGEVLLVPGKGIRLRTAERSGATQLDPRSVGGFQPGTLAFRLLQCDWVLGVGIEILDPWVTVRSLQEVTLREGQILTRINSVFRVENAAVRSLRIRLPGLNPDQVRTVRGSGSAVSDFVPVEGEGLWEIRFQRGIVGNTDVQIEFQGRVGSDQRRSVLTTPMYVEARQVGQFVSVRGSGRLELTAGDPPHGWQPIDWSAVPTELLNQADRSVPALCYRVAEPESGLAVTVSRHEIADGLSLRVTEAVLNTVFSPQGSFLTSVQLRMEVLEKSTLQVHLPAGARLFSTQVNGASVSVVREEDGHLFYVSPNSESDPSAVVRFVYALDEVQLGAIDLLGPRLSTPLENVFWRVVLPPGYGLDDYEGGFRLLGGNYAGGYGLEHYRSTTDSARSAEAVKGMALLAEASSLLQQGQQQEASEVLQRATHAQGLDEASNEDARVQLRALKTQQAVLGLNTRRQRLYLDNRMDTVRNEQLEQAANLNPFMQGRMNFDPRQVDQLLMGNTVEENTALRGIAARLVDQQLTAEPTPVAIEVTLPERGQILTFNRSLQVDGDHALSLELEISRTDKISLFASLAVLLGVAIVGVVLLPGKKSA